MVWTKRARFILTSLILSLGLLSTQFISFPWRYQAIGVLTVVSAALSAWVLAEELTGVNWLACLVLPSFYTASVGLFYFLLPERLITRIIILAAFAIGIYAILLTENIFSIAAGRTIQLLRAAQAVGFLMTLITVFFFYDTIFSFKLSPVSNLMLTAAVSLPLFFQSLWTVNLDKSETRSILIITSVLGFLIGQVAYAISFWPLRLWLTSLFLVTFFYIIVGLEQHQIGGRLFGKTTSEYFQVGLMVLILTFFLARWGGS